MNQTTDETSQGQSKQGKQILCYSYDGGLTYFTRLTMRLPWTTQNWAKKNVPKQSKPVKQDSAMDQINWFSLASK